MPDGDDKTEQKVGALETLASGGQGADVDALTHPNAKPAVMNSENALKAMAAGLFQAPDSTTAPPKTEDRQAMRAVRQRQASQVHALQFKRFLIPLLLTVGGLLLVLSVVTIFILLASPTQQDAAPRTSLRQYGPLLVIIACPLAALLMTGAWWFHRETRGARAE